MNRGASRKEYRELVAEYPGITIDRIKEGTHLKIYLTTPIGKKVLVVSRSPSDNRAFLNNKTLLSTWSKGLQNA